jgi:hemerythrin family non-heme iron protein
MKEAFDLFDRGGKGKITVTELKETLTSLGQDPTDDEVGVMVSKVDLDGNGTLEFDEFLSMMAAKVFGGGTDIAWAHKVPIPYIWDSSFSTLYKRIDDEHRHLFHTIWRCYDNRENSYDLLNMVATMQQHFTYEEGCMKASKHFNYARHKEVHDAYMEKLKHFAVPVKDKDIKYCMSWLVNHIKNTDFKYKNELLTNPDGDFKGDLLAV